MGSTCRDSRRPPNPNHVILFPFMSKGHTIPLLHLSRFLLRRGLSVTIFTTPSNRPFITTFLSDTHISILTLPFPQNIPNIPPGIESTDNLPSISLFFDLASSTKLMQPHFEDALRNFPNVSFILSDGFLWWTLESATKFGIPRFAFYGMSNYVMSLCRSIGENRLLHGNESDDELITVTKFPWIKVTRNDFNPPFTDKEPKGFQFEFHTKVITATTKSYGLIVNSFYELEPVFTDYWNSLEPGPKAWCVGPLCLTEQPPKPQFEKTPWVQWLDQKLEHEIPVLFVAFGSQAEISQAQLKEIAIGLENSGVSFLWVMRKKESEEIGDGFDGFEERVEERGIVIRDWVDQREILMHKSVQGFLSHCGWNSVMESICAGVPILAWPMMAEQPLNARMVEEEIKVGLRVETCDGSVRGFVKGEDLEKRVRELMEGEKGKEVRKKVKEVAEMARKAVEEGGSSWRTLDLLIEDTCSFRKKVEE